MKVLGNFLSNYSKLFVSRISLNGEPWVMKGHYSHMTYDMYESYRVHTGQPPRYLYIVYPERCLSCVRETDFSSKHKQATVVGHHRVLLKQ